MINIKNYNDKRIFVLNEPNAPRLNPALACEIGLNESIILLQLEYWISIGSNYKNDRYWTYQSATDFQEKSFPFWSKATINRAVKNLLDNGFLIEDNFNKKKYDKTRWFTLNHERLAELTSIKINGVESRSAQNESRSNQNESRSAQNESHSNQNESTIPENTTKNTTETTKEKNILQIKNLRSRYSYKQLIIIDQYLDILKWTRKHGNIAESVIVKIYEEWKKHKIEAVLYGLSIYINNPKHHDKKENYCYGIMRNATSEQITDYFKGGANNESNKQHNGKDFGF